MSGILPILAGITFNELGNQMGVNIGNLFGGNLFLIGVFFFIILMVFMFKAGLGIEGIVVIGAFALYAITFGISGTDTIAQGGFLPTALMIGFLILAGWIIYLAFIKRDILQ